MIKLTVFCITVISTLVWATQTFASIAPIRPLSEIKTSKEKKPSFDQDMEYLKVLERRYAGKSGKLRTQSPRVKEFKIEKVQNPRTSIARPKKLSKAMPSKKGSLSKKIKIAKRPVKAQKRI